MTDGPITAYPLAWPRGQARTTKARIYGQFEGTPGRIMQELIQELDRLVLGDKARTKTIRDFVVISSNAPRLKSGELSANAMLQHYPDPGVAVYFKRKGNPTCIACDRYDRIWKNLRAIQRTIEAMRAIERYGGSGLLDQAFRGFEALPAPGDAQARTWREVMGFGPAGTPSAGDVDIRWRQLCKERHPDMPGGSHEAMAELNTARDHALKELGLT